MSESAKPAVATVWLDGCSGCHMSLLDMDERILDIFTRSNLVYSPLVVPDSAAAVALNLAVVRSSGDGFGTVWPCSEVMPTTSNINFRAGVNIFNGVVAPISPSGDICIHLSETADIIVDVAGWFRGGGDASFVGAVPKRVVDTRIAVGPVPS